MEGVPAEWERSLFDVDAVDAEDCFLERRPLPSTGTPAFLWASFCLSVAA